MTGTRAVTREIRIAATRDAVWKALTDADELTRWFPPFARVTPGVGGRMWRRWQTGEEVEERIEIWTPDAHLRTVGLTNVWHGITTDYRLTTDGGTTILRVVSSGFSDDASWDALYDAFGGGWDFELLGLRHYLEHHAGHARDVVLVRGNRSLSADDSWRRLLGPGGWMGAAGLQHVAAGDRYSATAGGIDVSGCVALWQPPGQFAATVAEVNNAYLRIDTRCIGEQAAPWIWLSTYGVTDRELRALEQDWQRSLDDALAQR